MSDTTFRNELSIGEEVAQIRAVRRALNRLPIVPPMDDHDYAERVYLATSEHGTELVYRFRIGAPAAERFTAELREHREQLAAELGCAADRIRVDMPPIRHSFTRVVLIRLFQPEPAVPSVVTDPVIVETAEQLDGLSRAFPCVVREIREPDDPDYFYPPIWERCFQSEAGPYGDWMRNGHAFDPGHCTPALPVHVLLAGEPRAPHSHTAGETR